MFALTKYIFHRILLPVLAGVLFMCHDAKAQDTCTTKVSIQVTPGANICQGTQVSVTALDSNAGTLPTFMWYLNGQLVSSNPDYSSSDLSDGDSLAVVLTSSRGCVPLARDTESVVFHKSDIQATGEATPATCNQEDGTITLVNVSGGLAPYTFSLNGKPAQADSVFTDLEAGMYGIYVIDQAGCNRWLGVDVPIDSSISHVSVSDSPVNCGKTDGTISIDTIEGGEPPYTAILSNGSTLTSSTFPMTFTGLPVGAYSIDVQDASGCTFKVFYVNLWMDHMINDVPITSVAQTCYAFGSFTIDVQNITGGVGDFRFSLDGGNTYSYQSVYTGLPTDEYPLMVMDSAGCKYSTQAYVPFECDHPEDLIYVFNGFTPNSDGTNDTWTVSGIEILKSYKLQVFSRWGQKVFYTEDYDNNNGWDGMNHGAPLPEATYFYILEGVAWNDVKIEKHGSVTIVR